MRKSVLLLASVLLAVLLAGGVALAAVEGSAAGQEKIIFSSNNLRATDADTVGGDYELFTITPEGTDLQQITANGTHESNPAVSFDGTQVAFQGFGSQGNNPGIWRMNLDGSNKRRIGYGIDPAWSPNGRWIAFSRSFNRQSDIFKMKSLNGFNKTNLTNTGQRWHRETDPAWSPTTLRIAYYRGDPIYDIYQMRYDGSQQINLSDSTQLAEEQPDYSPSGNLIAFRSGGKSGLYKMRADGVGQASLIYDGDVFSPTWSPDGTQIAFTMEVRVADLTYQHDIFKINVDGSGLQNITDSPSVDEYEPDWYKVPTG